MLLTGCIVLGAVGVLAKEEESGRSVLAQILREVPSESGRFDVSQEVRLEKLFVELVRRIKSGDETLRSQIQFAEYVLKYKDALRRSFPDAYVDGLFVFEAVNISEVWKTFVRQDGYDIIADESVENSSEMQIEDANRVAGSGHERRRYTDLDNLFGPSKNKGKLPHPRHSHGTCLTPNSYCECEPNLYSTRLASRSASFLQQK